MSCQAVSVPPQSKITASMPVTGPNPTDVTGSSVLAFLTTWSTRMKVTCEGRTSVRVLKVPIGS